MCIKMSKLPMNIFKIVFSGEQDTTELTTGKRRRQKNYKSIITGFSFLIATAALVIVTVLFIKIRVLEKNRYSPLAGAPRPDAFSLINLTIPASHSHHEKMMKSLEKMNATLHTFLKYEDKEEKMMKSLEEMNATLNTFLKYEDKEEKIIKSLEKMNATLNAFLKYGDKVELCSVGIKTGLVKDIDLTASSDYGPPFGAKYGRLDRPGSVFAFWQPKDCGKAGEWLQVYLRTPTRVTGVVTQGRSDNIQDWVTGYKVAYGNSTDDLKNVQIHDNDVIFDGNTDMHTHKTNMLPQPIAARYFRIIVQTWTRCISLRMELITC